MQNINIVWKVRENKFTHIHQHCTLLEQNFCFGKQINRELQRDVPLAHSAFDFLQVVLWVVEEAITAVGGAAESAFVVHLVKDRPIFTTRPALAFEPIARRKVPLTLRERLLRENGAVVFSNDFPLLQGSNRVENQVG